MSFGDPILRGAALLLLLGGCARPTEVELRLFPCGLAGALPVKVELEVQGYDAAGVALAPLSASFAVAAGVLDDGYATVGLRPPAGISRADFTLTWRDAMGGAQVVMHAGLAVPKVGEVLELGADMCAPQGSSSSGTTGTSTGTSSGSETSSTSTGTSTGESTSTGEGESTGTSTSTGEGTSTSTSTSTGETGETTEASTTGEASMVGDGCNMAVDQFFCEHGGPGQLGTLLECANNTWKAADLKQRCMLEVFCPPTLLQVQPMAVGCSGEGAVGWACVCQDQPPVECLGDESGCLGNHAITLCVDDGQGKSLRTKGMCAVFCVDVDPAGPQCSENPP